MSAALATPRITLVGAAPPTLADEAVRHRGVADGGPFPSTDVVVVGRTVEDPIVVLQRLRGVGVPCPVVVVCDDPAALDDRARLAPLLPRDVTFTADDGVVPAVRAAASRADRRARSRAATAMANAQLVTVPAPPRVRSLRLLDELIAFSPVGVLVLEGGSWIALANDAAAGVLGRDGGDELLGRSLSDVAPDVARAVADAPAVTDAVAAAPGDASPPTGRGPIAPIELRRRDRTIELRHWALDEGVSARVVLLEDVSYRREAEQVLADAFAREHEAAEHLREVVRIKDSLISSISHELRTPVAVAKGMAETLLESGDLLTDEQRRHFTERIQRNVRRLERLIVTLLDLDRLKRGLLRPSVEEVDVEAVLARAVDEAAPDGRELAIEVAPSVQRAEVDGVWLERIVVNLLTNAGRYTPVGSPLELVVDRDGEALRVRLTDHGPGVPDDQKLELFQSFRQGPGGSTAGVGLGLSLVKQFAELHGGSVELLDTPGGGATFVVRLGRPDARPDGAR